MKTKNLEIAMKLAKITNRPLEEYYDGPCEEIKQEKEESVGTQEVCSSTETDDDVTETRDSGEEPIRQTSQRVESSSHTGDDELIKKYGGQYSVNGKLVGNTRTITRKEYLALTRNMTEQDVLASPLLYVLFRSEGQTNGHFVEWLAEFSGE